MRRSTSVLPDSFPDVPHPGRRLPAALLTAVVAIVASAVLGLVAASPASAWAPTSKSRPVLFVHGIDENFSHWNASTDCGADFNQMMGQMRVDGFVGPFVRVGYYAADTNCDANIHAAGTYQDRDSWKAIAKAFSWFVWNNYSRYNIEVDAVGYSMGGLIIRGAIYGARLHEAGFSPELNVGGAVTLGTPHYGSPLATACAWGQCSSLDAYHADMVWLRGDCNPQAWFGTMWTVFGSNDDAVVPWASAIAMCTYVDHRIVVEGVHHVDPPNYTHSVAVINQASNALGVPPGAISSGLGNKCIDVRNASPAPGTAAQIWDCNGSVAQIWTHSARGTWTTIQAVGRCLDRAGGSLAAGTKVQLWPCNGAAAQWWYPSPTSNTISAGGGMCLDVPAGNSSNGNQLQLWPCNNLPPQTWFLR